jgi:hypothetical protein
MANPDIAPKLNIDPTWDNLFFPPPKYDYFSSPAPDLSDPAAVDQWIVDAAILAYGRSGATFLDPQVVKDSLAKAGFQQQVLSADWAEEGAHWFFASNPTWAILSFRGTQKGDVTDLLEDLNIFLIDGQHRLRLDPTVPVCHVGFADAVEHVWPAIQEQLDAYRKANPDGEIYMTGHSLGAALAVVSADKYTNGPVSLITFGCPRVGNQPYNKRVERHVRRWTRYVDRNDLVTHVPPQLFGYFHGGDMKQVSPPARPDEPAAAEFARDGAVLALAGLDLAIRHTPPDDLADHSPCRYLTYVWKHDFGS